MNPKSTKASQKKRSTVRGGKTLNPRSTRSTSAAAKAAKKSHKKAKKASARKRTCANKNPQKKKTTTVKGSAVKTKSEKGKGKGRKRKLLKTPTDPVPAKKKQISVPTSTKAKPIKCVIYNQEFSSLWGLNKHVQQEHSTFTFGCPMKDCKYKFSTITTLIKHRKVFHSTHTFECETCGKKFAYQKDLNDHRDTHQDEAKYPCTHSKYACAFKTKASLKAHLKVHDNVTYPCDECEFASATKVGLHQHKKGKHGQGTKCEKCRKLFRWNSQLACHKTSYKS